MRRTPLTVIGATATASLLALGLAAAPMAQAYPPGKQQKTETNKDQVRTDGRFKAAVTNAQPGCRVVFSVVNAKGKVVDSRAGTVGDRGAAQREFSPAPNKPGTYTVVTTVSGKGCAESQSSSTITVVAR